MRTPDKSVFSIPVVIPVVSMIILFIFIAVVFPGLFKDILGKERFIEHVSHLILIFSIALCLPSIGKDRRRNGRVFFLIMLVVLLLEETDYGGVYGFYLARDFFSSNFHVVNFHNRINLPFGITFDLYWIFKWLIFLYFFFPLFGNRKLKEWFYPFIPSKNEIIAVSIIALFREDPFGFLGASDYYFQELSECLLYYLFLAIALRGYNLLKKNVCPGINNPL